MLDPLLRRVVDGRLVGQDVAVDLGVADDRRDLAVGGRRVDLVEGDGERDVRAVGGGAGRRRRVLAGSGGDGDGEGVAGDEVGGAVGDGEGQAAADELRADGGDADNDAVRILDDELAEVGRRLDADGAIDAGLGAGADRRRGERAVAGVAGDRRRGGGAERDLADDGAGRGRRRRRRRW